MTPATFEINFDSTRPRDAARETEGAKEEDGNLGRRRLDRSPPSRIPAIDMTWHGQSLPLKQHP